jgi:aminomethyltransferase
MDRSHEGRLESIGRDRIDVIQRISTNDLSAMQLGEGRPTILTNPQGRIIDRLIVYNQGETALMTTEPGRGAPVQNYLQRQVFFNDEFQMRDLAVETRLFALHGPAAGDVVRRLSGQRSNGVFLACFRTLIEESEVIFAERKPLSREHWIAIVPNTHAESLWKAILKAGEPSGLIPAGSLTYNALRIRAGQPGVGRELSSDFIPLETGLWDEVSFTKGCYTGQEIIARMESRNRLAKTIVKLQLTRMVEPPARLYAQGKEVGILTSSVILPDGDIPGIGFVKVALANVGQSFAVGENGAEARITELAGAQPPMLQNTHP